MEKVVPHRKSAFKADYFYLTMRSGRAFGRSLQNREKSYSCFLDLQFSKSNKPYKRRKLIYCYTKNLSNIFKRHNKKVTIEKITPRDQCNWRNNNNCPLDGDYQASDIIQKCIATNTVHPDKVYLETAEGNFTRR